MPNPIQLLTLAQFRELLDEWQPKRKITAVHVHCTDQPNHSNFKGRASIEAMRQYHMIKRSMRDIAQHITIDPQGLIWTGRPFDMQPASAIGFNGDAIKGPFMFEMVGLFNKGKDTFGGAQAATAYGVTAAILSKFKLGVEAIRFHNEFTDQKTCPGNAIQLLEFRKKVQELLDAVGHIQSAGMLPANEKSRTLNRDAILFGDTKLVSDLEEVPEDSVALEQQQLLAELLDGKVIRAVQLDGEARDLSDDFSELKPHVINTSQGVLSNSGLMNTTSADLDVMIHVHLNNAVRAGYKHVVFYAHGGLVSERAALCYAKLMAPWWRAFKIYPIFFIWESGLFSTISGKVRGMTSRDTRDFGDFVDKVSEVLTQKMAREIWRKMKSNARHCSAKSVPWGEQGGLNLFHEKFAAWYLGLNPTDRPKLHGIGHSTGPILLADFMPLLLNRGIQFETLNYLAPAIRTDDFLAKVEPLVDGAKVKRLRVFTMNETAERADNVVKIYRKSLLYYVRNACEDKDRGRIFGLQEDLFELKSKPSSNASLDSGWDGFKLRDPDDFCSPLNYGLQTRFAVEFSQSHRSPKPNEKTQATAHGGFDNDSATMHSVLANVLGVSDTIGLVGGEFPSETEFKRCRELESESGRALGEEDSFDSGDDDLSACGCRCCEKNQGPSPFDLDWQDSDDDNEDQEQNTQDSALDLPSAISKPPSAGSSQSQPGKNSGKKAQRLAVCVGINAYPEAPLEACIKDRDAWSTWLDSIGFEVVQKLGDAGATRKKLHASLESLIAKGRKGDHLVFQFSGHGTQTKDLSGDESDPFDEVIVPYDYLDGELWLDDDLHALCKELSDGVHLTFLMDCCHSGTNTRFAPRLTRAAGLRARWLKLPSRAVVNFERNYPGVRATSVVNEHKHLPGVISFSACRSTEVAYEQSGHGDFTRHGLKVAQSVLNKNGSNASFRSAVLKSMGTERRQNPTLDALKALHDAAFLGGA